MLGKFFWCLMFFDLNNYLYVFIFFFLGLFINEVVIYMKEVSLLVDDKMKMEEK